MQFIQRLFGGRDKDIPFGVRIITIATAIRWAGWGFAESLLPVFIFSFAKNYATTGLFSSAYDFAFILALPLAGLAADRMPATTIILIGLSGYFFIGTSYFLAGVFGIATFIIIARILNGVSYALDSVGRETYLRRHVPAEKFASTVGYFDTVANFWWIMASVAGIFLIGHFAIHQLLFLIVPTSAITFAMVFIFRRHTKERRDPVRRTLHLSGAYGVAVREFLSWRWELKSLAFFSFCIAFSATVVGFFLPIETFARGATLPQTMLVGIVFALPALLGWTLGKWFDRKGSFVFLHGLVAFAALVASLAFFQGYAWTIFVAFAIGIVIELLYVGNGELVTLYARPEHFGRTGSVIKSVSDMGSLAGPLTIGFVIDRFGPSAAFALVAALLALLAAVFVVMKARKPNTSLFAGGRALAE